MTAWRSLPEVLREHEAEAADYLAGREERLAAKTRDEPKDDRRQVEQAEPEPKPEDDP